MGKKYYILNGNSKEANVVNMKVDDKLQHEFVDIATIDLETMQIDVDKAKDTIQEYNPKIELTNEFIDIEKKANTSYDFHGTLFDLNDPRLTSYFNELRELAEKRDYNIKNKGTVSLSTSDTKPLRDKLLHKIIDSKNAYIASKDSILIPNMKAILEKRLSGSAFICPADNLIKYLDYQDSIYNPLRSYAEIRKLFIEYAYLLGHAEQHITNNMINDYQKCIITGGNFAHQYTFNEISKEEDIKKVRKQS